MVDWVRTRQAYEREEFERLAPYATKSGQSRGRVVAEPEHVYRTVFQRDRDRIVHARAFRRLEDKTQVFVYSEGDHYRNRLTHTLEGGQIARTIARTLRLNEELAEAVVLAHDLGHTPFGHAGERVLAELMRETGGFDHNRQSLRVVDLLEQRHPEYRGLNLSYETREGILKHGCHWEHPLPVPEQTSQPSLEAQVADFADEIAYTVHDLDDGLRAGLLAFEDLESIALWGESLREVRERFGSVEPKLLVSQAIRTLIDRLVTQLIEASAQALQAVDVDSVDAVRRTEKRIIGFGSALDQRRGELREFLYENFYEHPRVVAASGRAAAMIRDLFAAYRSNEELLPPSVCSRFVLDGRDRAVSDYIAGMTDRFALDEHRRIQAGDARP